MNEPNRNTEWAFFKGKGSFFDNLLRGDQEYKNWNVRCTFIPESAELFRELQMKKGEIEGIMNELKTGEDGPYHHFKRPFFKDFGDGEVPLTPPEVLDKDNQPWNRNVGIGNGSDITVKVEVYTFTNRRTRKKGRAIRLAAVRIDNHIPYTRDDLTSEQQHLTMGLEQISGQPF